ncbi:MAG: hypothetical protein Q8Q09_11035 [Deltaproteobacteria bacterium]|nr:hypothetical protein [Deltaproteobacteria bacterium]
MITQIERSPSGRARCRRCNEPIAKGAVRAVFNGTVMGVEASESFLHFRCAIDVDAVSTEAALALFDEPFDERAELTDVLRQRTRAIAECKKPVAERDPERMRVEGARDPSGRPRVRVLLAGSAFSWGTLPSFELDRVTKDRTFRSSKREYQFVVQYTGIADADEDPSQPVIAAVFAPFAGAKVMNNQRLKLTSWRDRALPTPLLWVFTRAAQTAPKDEQIQGLRALLDDVGYVGDEATVCVARGVNGSTLAALAAALDESVETITPPKVDARPSDLKLAAKIEALVADRAESNARQALTHGLLAVRLAKKNGAIAASVLPHLDLRKLSPAGRDALGRAAVSALAMDNCLDEAIALLTLTLAKSEDPEPLVASATAPILAALTRLLAKPSKTLSDHRLKDPKRLKALTSLACAHQIKGRTAPLLVAIADGRADRSLTTLATALLAAKAPRAEERLLRWIDGLAEGDPRVTLLAATRRTLMTRAKRRAAKRA